MADCPLECKEGRGESLFQFPINVPSTSRAWKAAVDVFQDPELTALCEDGLSKQLQRTKDGATEQSRIQELAGRSVGLFHATVSVCMVAGVSRDACTACTHSNNQASWISCLAVVFTQALSSCCESVCVN